MPPLLSERHREAQGEGRPSPPPKGPGTGSLCRVSAQYLFVQATSSGQAGTAGSAFAPNGCPSSGRAACFSRVTFQPYGSVSEEGGLLLRMISQERGKRDGLLLPGIQLPKGESSVSGKRHHLSKRGVDAVFPW